MVFEDQRALHEDVERLEEAISKRYMEEPPTDRERLQRDHEVAGFVDRMHDQALRLKAIYSDTKQERQQETEQLATGDTFGTFYGQLKKIKDFHKRYPNEPAENLEKTYAIPVPVEGQPRRLAVDSMFSEEEYCGKFLDLISQHERYMALPGLSSRRLSYMQYMEFFDQFNGTAYEMEAKHKLNDEYFQYVSSLAEYLEDFFGRTRPLENLRRLMAAIDDDFEKAWSAQQIEGWQKKTSTNGNAANGSSEKPDEPMVDGIWCADCSKEFSNQNTYNAHLTGKKHIKNAKERAEAPQNGDTKASKPAASNSVGDLRARAIAEREFRVTRLANMMQTQRHDTKINIERRAQLTERERQLEREAQYHQFDMPAESGARGRPGEGGDDDDDKVYNPLKLPMNWDGKPIPYWLYKLHGLGIEYPCEICGGYVYHGRRAYEKHFGEARHVWGLRALGITPSAVYREIASIDEARALHAKIDGGKKVDRTKGRDVEEMEDSLGNVMPRKVYEDLQAAGLV